MRLGMSALTIPLYDIPPQGMPCALEDPAVFDAPIAEFGMDCRVTTPLRAAYTLMPVDSGCLIRGTLTGAVIVPCDRCAEDCAVAIHHKIETFAPFPAEAEQDADTGADDASHHIHIINGVSVLDLAALSWEEFLLALPPRPLCVQACKGLCPQCGVNLNTGSCDCVETGGDPRLALLRSLQIPPKETSHGCPTK